MKIRTDFVTNSSSTSFVIITEGELNRQDFFELMGITNQSPLAPIFNSLYTRLVEKMTPIREETDFGEHAQGKELKDLPEADFSAKVIKKMIEAKEKGRNVYVGKLSSEEDMMESFFCCDSFEVENEKIYFNGLECAW